MMATLAFNELMKLQTNSAENLIILILKPTFRFICMGDMSALNINQMP